MAEVPGRHPRPRTGPIRRRGGDGHSISSRQWITPEVLESVGGNTWGIGVTLFDNMLLPFEVASLLLVAAMVGAIIMARKEKRPSVSIRVGRRAKESQPDGLEQRFEA